jgi:sugar phosphate isomerase/epimerase
MNVSDGGTMSEIKRGVSLYSYQEEFFLRKLTLEQCVAVSASMGAYGIETLAEQMMPGYPKLSDAFYQQWHEWMRIYGATPTCHDAFLDTKRYKNRLLTLDEQVAEVTRDIEHAERLGAKIIRMLVLCSPELMERCAPIAADHGIWLGVEVHSPFSIDHEWIQRHLEVAYRVGTDKLGIVPDLGIFVERFPRVIYERALRDGAHEDLVRMMVQRYDRHEDVKGLIDEVTKMGGNTEDIGLARTVGFFVSSDPKRLRDVIGAAKHIHGKFYEMTDEGCEYSIPYNVIVPILAEAGYAGYISSEYEGNRHIEDAFPVDSVEQVRRHQRMLAKLIGKQK